MKTLEMSKATASLAEYARTVKNDPVILTIDGKPVAGLFAIENADAETIALSTNHQFVALIEHSRARQRTEGGISSTEMRQRLGLKKTPRAKQ
ncbi:MAG: hypothetical protein HY868_08715 [Chloroflexi bacterium]|nr:hypothetical protein [Chloroflexota bacterium]